MLSCLFNFMDLGSLSLCSLFYLAQLSGIANGYTKKLQNFARRIPLVAAFMRNDEGATVYHRKPLFRECG